MKKKMKMHFGLFISRFNYQVSKMHVLYYGNEKALLLIHFDLDYDTDLRPEFKFYHLTFNEVITFCTTT